MPMNPKISIVVVTWNVRDSLERCLASIDGEADLPFEIFVVDNDSKDSTKDFLRVFAPKNPLLTKYEIIYNDANLGYSGAADKGLSRVRGDYALLLNPDTVILPRSFSTMIAYAETREKLGGLGVKILNPDGSIQSSVARLPTITSQLAIRLGLHKSETCKKLLGDCFSFAFDYNKPAEVEQLKGAVMLIPKHILETVGLWDDGFFLWFEDTDFCARVRKAGYKLYYTPDVSILHESQAGIATIPLWKRQIIWEKSIFRYFWKHHGLLSAVAISILDPVCMMIGMIVKKFQNKK